PYFGSIRRRFLVQKLHQFGDLTKNKNTMKILASAILALSIPGSSLMAQDIPASQVPSVVTNAFAQEYTNPTDVDWEKERKNFEVDFELEDIDHVALFSPEGQLLKAKRDMRDSDLPQ